MTPAEPMEKLVEFYRKVRPEGPGWKRVALQSGATSKSHGGLALQFANWFLGCVLIYGFLFGVGYLIFGVLLKGVAFLLGGLIAGALIMRNLKSARSEEHTSELQSLRHLVCRLLLE